MFIKYKGRIISTVTFIFFVTLWDSIYYGIYDYKYNFILDTSYSLVVVVVIWWLSSYYDKSRNLLTHLSESEEKNKRLSESTNYVFNNLNQVVYQVDGNGKLTLLNNAWELLTGFSIQESLGQTLMSYVYPEDRIFANEIAYSHLERKLSTLQKEVRLRKKDGGYIWIEVITKTNYDSSGNLESAVGTLTDITHWKSSESELLQMNEDLSMESEKMSVIAQMSAAIAHEVRNPLTSIFGFIQLLRENKHLKDEYIDVIFSEIDRINLVLSEMLMLAKPQVVSFKKIDLNQTLNHVLALVSSEANMKSIELTKQTSAMPIWIYGEENRLKQVFINIIKNAIEAMESGGSIEIYQDTKSDFVSIYVKDNGPGIPKEIVGMIGQPFYTSKEKGTGLGLTICFKIIETHKGKIHISSELGAGTTFEVILPVYRENGSLDKELVEELLQ